MLADGIHVDGYGQMSAKTSYESNVPFVLRFMVRVSPKVGMIVIR